MDQIGTYSAGMVQHPLESRIKALEEKLASYDVRLKVLENLDAAADTDEFAHFWKEYPRKVGKGQARKAFKAACKKTDFNTIMNGLSRYQRNKPATIDWKHPATWLNSEGWEDDWTGEVERKIEVPQIDPDRVIRDKLAKMLGDRQKAAQLYNYFLGWKHRRGLFERAFEGRQEARKWIEDAAATMWLGGLRWPDGDSDVV